MTALPRAGDFGSCLTGRSKQWIATTAASGTLRTHPPLHLRDASSRRDRAGGRVHDVDLPPTRTGRTPAPARGPPTAYLLPTAATPAALPHLPARRDDWPRGTEAGREPARGDGAPARRPVRWVLSAPESTATVIHLGRRLPGGSSGRPEGPRRRRRCPGKPGRALLFGLAPGRACPFHPAQPAFADLPARLCGAGPRLTADGCYPLPCAGEPGVPHAGGCPPARDRPAASLADAVYAARSERAVPAVPVWPCLPADHRPAGTELREPRSRGRPRPPRRPRETAPSALRGQARGRGG